MTRQPLLKTPRLVLRAFEPGDAAAVHALISDPRVLATLRAVPDPYEEGTAARWIASHPEALARGESVAWAVTLRAEETLVGAVGLTLKLPDARASLGYWIGRAWWGRGIATEAARAVVAYGFGEMNLHRVHADHMVRNAASGRVMRKLGMTFEGRLRHHFIKRGVFEDVDIYGLLRDEFRPDPATA